MAGIRDLQIGRILLPGIQNDVVETIGDKFNVVGASVVPGEPQARPFSLTIPVHGDPGDGTALYSIGNKMRRQLRSLIDNPTAGRMPIYMQLGSDRELDSWLAIGSGDLKYSDGGVSLSEFELVLTDCYQLGRRRQLYQGYQITNNDLRTGLTPRDILRTVYSTDFAATAVPATGWGLPPIATKAFSSGGRTLAATVANWQTIFGLSVMLPEANFNYGGLTGYGDGMVVAWEDQPTADANSRANGDVLIHDRRGITAPTLTVAGDKDMETYGWEEVYGPNYPVSNNDCPVLSNARCRVQWVDSTQAFMIEGYTPSTGKFEEVGRVNFPVSPDSGGGTNQPVLTRGTVANFAQVISWTPYAATIKITLGTYENPVGTPSATDQERAEVYVTLRAHWDGPKIEVYRHTSSGTPSANRAGMRVAIPATTTTTFGSSMGSATTTPGGASPNTAFTGATNPGWWLTNSTGIGMVGCVFSASTKVKAKESGGTQDGYAASSVHAGVDFTGSAADTLGNSYLGLGVAAPRDNNAAVVAPQSTAIGGYAFFGAGMLHDMTFTPILIAR